MSEWYGDPTGRFQMRYWDGAQWTEHVVDSQRAQLVDHLPDASVYPPPTQSVVDHDPAAVSDDRRRRGVKGLLDAGKQATSVAARTISDVGADVRQRVSDADGAGALLSSTGKQALARASSAAHDPALRATLQNGLGPVLQSAAEGARVTNKKGEISKMRVLRAVTRPRKTMMGVAAGVGQTAASQALEAATRSGSGVATTADSSMWSAGAIAEEWPTLDPLEVPAVLQYAALQFAAADWDDRVAMRVVAAGLCGSIAHCLLGAAAVHDDSIVEATSFSLNATLRDNDWDTWTDADDRHLRLALAVARRYGVQPVELGGNGELEDFFGEPRTRMLMAMAISRNGWCADLFQWFQLTN